MRRQECSWRWLLAGVLVAALLLGRSCPALADGGPVLSIQDNGTGIAQPQSGAGLGLRMMQIALTAPAINGPNRGFLRPNAALAVIKWKKILGVYADLEMEQFSAYSLAGNRVINEGRG